MLTLPATCAAGTTMTSREIGELTGKRHDQVLRTARDLVEQGITQSVECQYQATEDGRSYPQHMLNKRDSLVLVARLSPEFTGRVVDRWLELEAAVPQAPAELSRLQVLELAMASERERLVLAEQLAAAAPAVEFVDRYVDSTGLKGFRQVCKLLRANENDFRKFLEDAKIMYRLGGEWTPYAQHLGTGRFDVKAGTSTVTGHAFNTARFTPKGVTWVAGEYAKWQLRPVAEEALP